MSDESSAETTTGALQSAEKGAPVIAGLEQSGEACWSPTTPDGLAFEWGDGTPHWQSEDEGRKTIEVIRAHYGDDPPTLVLSRENAPCWHLICADCGYRYDEDEWVSHFADRDEALSIGEDCDWHVVDGKLLCSECYLEHLRSTFPPGHQRSDGGS